VTPPQEFEKAMAAFVLHYKVASYPNADIGIDAIDHTPNMEDMLVARCTDWPNELASGLMAGGLEFEAAANEAAYKLWGHDDIEWSEIQHVEKIYFELKDPMFELIDIYEEDEIKLIQENLNTLYPISAAFQVVIFLLYILLAFYYVNQIVWSYCAELYLISLFMNNDQELFKINMKKFHLDTKLR
jgi:hypothetical protein